MNDLIKVNYENDRPTVSGRELHDFLEINEKYTQWFKRMCEYGFSESIDYFMLSEKTETNNPKNPFTTITNHQLTIEMAKELCMLQRNEKGKIARTYFINLEKAWNTPEMVMTRALKLADKKIVQLSESNQELEKKIEQSKPKVLFADAVTTAKTSILVGDLAKLIKQNGYDIGQKRLFMWLRENGYLIRRKGSDWNMPTQRSMEMGLFEIKESTHINGDGVNVTTKTPKVTGKGQIYFINKFLESMTA